MKILIKRFAFKENYTIGKLYADNIYTCDTLEDEVREPKIQGITAIPAGKYLSNLTWSARFKSYLPIIENVPNFEGIRIHAGNTASDTEGCILVGKNEVKGKVLESKQTLEKIVVLYKEAINRNEIIEVEIK
ncbi:MAG: DUF5675 family protein [Endomicrobium sp.]|jgi:hypothetical protein|nr:DUF5675 family protein [Endomicrobium sp.]